MDKKLIEFNKEQRGGKTQLLQAGDIVEVHLKIKEKEKERIQVFEGLIIAIKGKQSSSPTITVRKISHGVGVEMIIPLLSKNVAEIKLIKRAKVRRAKLYYVRNLTVKQSRMKYKDIKKFVAMEKEKPMEEDSEEKVEEEKAVEQKADEKKEIKKEKETTEKKKEKEEAQEENKTGEK